MRNESDDLRDANGAREPTSSAAPNEFVADSAAFAVDGRLTDVPVVVIAERGVAEDVVDDTAQLVRRRRVPTCPRCSGSRSAGSSRPRKTCRRCATPRTCSVGASSVRTRALGELAARLDANRRHRVEEA